jgi:hypothetical protein
MSKKRICVQRSQRMPHRQSMFSTQVLNHRRGITDAPLTPEFTAAIDPVALDASAFAALARLRTVARALGVVGNPRHNSPRFPFNAWPLDSKGVQATSLPEPL